MITPRDQDIINTIEEFHVLSSKQIRRLFFPTSSYQFSSKRLKYLAEQGYIKRAPSTIDNGYAYFIQRPAQLHHDLIRAELYANMKQIYEVLEWHNEFTIDHIRPDALAYVRNKGIVYPVLVEVHLSKQFDFDKYRTDLYPYFGVRPTIIICTDSVKNVPSTQKFKTIGLDMSGLDSLFK